MAKSSQAREPVHSRFIPARSFQPETLSHSGLFPSDVACDLVSLLRQNCKPSLTLSSLIRLLARSDDAMNCMGRWVLSEVAVIAVTKDWGGLAEANELLQWPCAGRSIHVPTKRLMALSV